MLSQHSMFIASVLISASLIFFALFFSSRISAPSQALAAFTATTTVQITICGDGLIGFGEVCDVVGGNDGAYATSTAGHHCNATCTAFAPYCGDQILQALYGEECDDGNNLSGDHCSDVCKQEVSPTATTTPYYPPSVPGGFGASSGAISLNTPTKVVIDGKAYPGSYVHILKDGVQLGVVPVGVGGDFHFEVSGLTAGPAVFGFWAEDSAKARSITLTTTFQIVESAVTTVSGVLLPPTISADEISILPGKNLNIFGESVPSSSIFPAFDSSAAQASGTKALVDGKWNLSLSTAGLQNEALHTIKVQSEIILSDGSVKRSGFSQSVGFYLGTKDISEVISTDVNGDGKVNLIDFSILLFYWGTSEITVDFNRDGKVNLTDFSILLFNWTG